MSKYTSVILGYIVRRLVILIINIVLVVVVVKEVSDYCVFPQDCSTALHWAAHYGQNKIISFLLARGARMDSVDDVS